MSAVSGRKSTGLRDGYAPRVAVIGGGAAGFFAAIRCARENPRASITILEGNRRPLGKVRISGGGRCNLTHACFDPGELVRHYPRGGRELRGAFSRFQPRDTVEWFRQHGVECKTEADGRMFPVSDDSATIIECLLEAAREAGVRLICHRSVTALTWSVDSGGFELHYKDAPPESFNRVLLSCGGNPAGFAFAADLGHRIAPPVPSIFTFSLSDPRLRDLPGVAVSAASVRLPAAKLSAEGPLLITHWGLSGPAVLRLSAFAARQLHEHNYRMELRVNWRPDETETTVRDRLLKLKSTVGARLVAGECGGLLPSRLWRSLAVACGADNLRWSQVPAKILSELAREVTDGVFHIQGKGVFKEEFVTCGGVALREVDFRTMQSRRVPGLFFAGEVLDIDGVTGGFNFQSAWTTGWIAGQALAGHDDQPA
jgi:hypothetical protein